jgi:hypothetical protein
MRMYSWPDKAFSAAVAAFSTAVLGVARCLWPSAAGMGTHERLGLPPCRFHVLTGIPCPSCGLTTSFAYAAHFQFQQAFLASPFGLLLFFVTVLLVPLSVILWWRRTSWRQLFETQAAWKITGWMVVTYIASWIYKVAAVSAAARFMAER